MAIKLYMSRLMQSEDQPTFFLIFFFYFTFILYYIWSVLDFDKSVFITSPLFSNVTIYNTTLQSLVNIVININGRKGSRFTNITTEMWAIGLVLVECQLQKLSKSNQNSIDCFLYKQSISFMK